MAARNDGDGEFAEFGLIASILNSPRASRTFADFNNYSS